MIEDRFSLTIEPCANNMLSVELLPIAKLIYIFKIFGI